MTFDRLAPDYDRLRTAGGRWQELAELAIGELGTPSRLLDVGCGTGRFAVFAAERTGARVWGVDPSPEMLAQARARPGGRRIGWKQSVAERLPFRDGWFDAVHLQLVLHLVDDRRRAVGELARVLRAEGRLAAVTFELDHFDGFVLNRYFPSIPRIDRDRFPDPGALVAELRDRGFGAVDRRRISHSTVTPAADMLDRVRGRYISTLRLIDEDEYRRGLAELERDVEAGVGEFRQALEWCLISATRE
ncbi:MAG TPA: methyltransferase domain-containing protein [Gaiellales bacterium]|nr:methyltransferase domain-containing protein [Gaiellales bacterium]